MSAVADPVETSSAPTIVKPFAEDHNAPRHRRRRAWIIATVAGFCLFYGMAFAFLAPFLILIFTIPILILGALVIWALPGVRTAPTGALEGLFFAFFITLILWPNYLAIGLPGLPWITVNRLTGFPLVFLLLVCVSVSADFRARLGQSLNAAPLIWKLLLAFVVIQLFSIALSDQKAESIDKFVVAQVSWTAVFFISAYLFLKPGRIEIWAAIMWIMAIAVGAIAIVEYRYGHPLWAGHVPGFLKIGDPVVASIMEGHGRAYTGVYRAQSTFSTSLGLAEYLALSLPFVLHFIFQPYRWAVRIAAAASIPLLVLAVILSGSRLGLLGMIVAVMLYALFWGVMRWRRRRDSILGPAIVLSYPAVGVAVLAATLFIGRLHRMVWGGAETVASTEARRTQYQMGIPMVLRHPFGYGIGRAADTLGFHEPGGLLTIDTYYLSIALEYGIIGLIVYYFTIIITAYYGSRITYVTKAMSRANSFVIPTCISLVTFVLVKSVFSEDGNHPVVFMMLGIVAAICYQSESGGAVTSSRRHR